MNPKMRIEADRRARPLLNAISAAGNYVLAESDSTRSEGSREAFAAYFLANWERLVEVLKADVDDPRRYTSDFRAIP